MMMICLEPVCTSPHHQLPRLPNTTLAGLLLHLSTSNSCITNAVAHGHTASSYRDGLKQTMALSPNSGGPTRTRPFVSRYRDRANEHELLSAHTTM